VSAHDADVAFDPEFFKRLNTGLDDWEVAVAAHYNGGFKIAHEKHPFKYKKGSLCPFNDYFKNEKEYTRQEQNTAEKTDKTELDTIQIPSCRKTALNAVIKSIITD